MYSQIVTDAHPDLYLRLAEAMRALGDEETALRYSHLVRDGMQQVASC